MVWSQMVEAPECLFRQFELNRIGELRVYSKVAS